MKGVIITISESDFRNIIKEETNKIVTELEKKLIESNIKDTLSVKEASKVIGLKPSTIYQYVSENKIPHNKIGKRLTFSRKELIEWVEAGRPDLIKTAKEIIMKNTRQGVQPKTGIN